MLKNNSDKIRLSWGNMIYIVEDVMVRNVVSANLYMSVKQAALEMTKLSIGCLVITSEDGIVGMVTERDILKKVVSQSLDADDTLLKDIMSEPVIMAYPDMPIESAVELMFKHRIKKLPIIRKINGKTMLVGLVTLTDIARLQPQLIETLQEMFRLNEETPPKNMEKVIKYYVV